MLMSCPSKGVSVKEIFVESPGLRVPALHIIGPVPVHPAAELKMKFPVMLMFTVTVVDDVEEARLVTLIVSARVPPMATGRIGA